MAMQQELALSRNVRLFAQACVATTCCFAALAYAADPPVADAPDEQARISFASTGSFSVTIGGTQVQTLWKRELMRQALLLAARSEMNYLTTDNALGDGVSRTKPSLELTCKAGTPDRIQLLLGPTGKREPVWTQEFKFDSPWPPQRAWVERMELMSRTEFVQALEKAKFAKRPALRAKDPAASLDPALVRMIDEDLSFLGQFLALRQLHARMVSEGETAARFAGLVRAYAHLGILTEYQWHPMSYAFKARALLYAQRWVVREPKSPSAWQHRAYAFALVGMHGDALTDLQTAQKLAGDSSAKSNSPSWVPLIEHFCQYDFEDLKRLRADEHLKPLASLLYFLAHEQEGSSNLTVKVGLEMIEEMPGCYRMLDTLCHHTGPGAGQLTTQVGPRHLAMTLLPRLEKVGELPPHVRLTLDQARGAGAMLKEDADEDDIKAEIEHRGKLITALRGIPLTPEGQPASAPDRIEPSWSVLAKLIEETTFLQTFRRVYFVRVGLGLPADDYLDTYRPIVANHRRIAFLDQFHTQADSTKLTEAIQTFGLTYVDFAQSRIWVQWPANIRRQIQTVAMAHKEVLANEAGLAAQSYPPDINLGAGSLLAVSPHSPYAMGVALYVDAPRPEAEKGWEQVAKHSPFLAASFAQVLARRGDRAKAGEYLKLAAELDPSLENYRRLADHFKAQGNDERWLKALDEYLKTPSLGLDHARVQCEIAQYYGDRREWDKALPYADAAAETGAQWAMSAATTVNEANQNWETAETMQVASIQRYGEHPVMWYFFCQRNGCGHLDLARKATFPNGVEQFAAEKDAPVNLAALALVLEGNPKKALDLLEVDNKKAPASWTAMMGATIADQVGDSKKRDALLNLAVEQRALSPNENDARPQRQELTELARKLIADLSAGGKCTFDFEKLNASRDRAAPRDRCAFSYFLGAYLDQRGKSDLAVQYWKQCMGASDLIMQTRTLAGFELHKRGVKPGEWKELLFAKPEAAK